jgi:hypothetical protein
MKGDLQMYPIKMTNKQVQEAVEKFRKQLKGIKSSTNTIRFEFCLTSKEDAEATLHITLNAWRKMHALITKCDKEIAWHGVVHKEGRTYTITDVLLFPQTVTAATVTSDETEYSLWLAQQPNEVFNNLRFHGHSHVNMGVSPSGTDTQYQADMLKNLNDFYIFAIFNKSGKNWVNIYDVEDNIVYEDADIDVVIEEDEIENWADTEMAAKVKRPQVAYCKKETPGMKAAKEAQKPKSITDDIVDRYYDKSGKFVGYQQRTLGDYDNDYYGGYYGR